MSSLAPGPSERIFPAVRKLLGLQMRVMFSKFKRAGKKRKLLYILVWFLILLWMRDRHPRLLDESGELGAGRRWVALVLGVILLLSFIPLPVQLIEGG